MTIKKYFSKSEDGVEKELVWKAELGIEEMVRDAWKFEQNNK